MMTERVMVDIETLGTKPGCAIVAIGAVKFDINEGVSDELFASVDLESCEDYGLHIDASTVLWWLRQSPDARKHVLDGECLDDALRDLSRVVESADEIWANSPAFDCAILRAGYGAIDWEAPWEYWEERDYRTMRAMARWLDIWPDRERDGTHHNALDDARYQAECLVAVLQAVEAAVNDGGEDDG